MKKSFWYSVMEGVLLILPPLLVSAVLSVLHILLEQASPVFGALTWLAWLVSLVFAIRRKSAGGALGLAVLLFFSCGFYGLSLAADYGFFTFPAGIHALFTLFGAPYDVTASGVCFFLPEEGASAILTCMAYLALVVASSGYAAYRFGKKKKRSPSVR
ncbi:MAG: hypothetical protein IJ325_13865 [Clostridia bacterium]|nr:hypothetical protein [Clostridia bacterium]